jgi:hypothetical protein
MSKAAEYRVQAHESEERAKDSKSLKIGALERKRAESLYALADNEDWLNGETASRNKVPRVPHVLVASLKR